MKKIFTILVLMIMFVLSACSKNSNELFDIDYETYSSQTLKIVTEKEVYSVKDTEISYSITNIGHEEGFINSDSNCFVLHKLVDGEWKRVGEKTDHYWTEVALMLAPGQVETREINLEEYYFLPLEKGEYRIAIEGLASNTFKIS